MRSFFVEREQRRTANDIADRREHGSIARRVRLHPQRACELNEGAGDPELDS